VNRFLKIWLSLLCVAIFFLCGGLSYSDQGGDGPIIHIEQTTHTFPPAFEGEVLSHNFTVINRGTADLHIENVTHS